MPWIQSQRVLGISSSRDTHEPHTAIATARRSFNPTKLFSGASKCHPLVNELEEAMGHNRPLSLDALVRDKKVLVPEQALVVPRNTADFFELKVDDARRSDRDVRRQARELREDWRRKRYSRLKAG
jgi:hypothetical protein